MPKSAMSPEFLVVGAGAVGLLLAVYLARQGRRVTLLEAGPATPDANFRKCNSGIVRGKPHLGLMDGRMKSLGGTTRIWGGQLTAFSRADFQRRIEGIPSWPIGYDEIAPYIASVYEFLNEASSGGVCDPALMNFDDTPDVGPNLQISRHLWLPKADFADLFRKDIDSLKTLTVVTGVKVTTLQFEGASVVTVTARSDDGTLLEFEPEHTVLANGTFEMVRLLLCAALDRACPFGDNPNLGQGYIDHLHGLAGVLKQPNKARLRAWFEARFVNGVKVTTKIRASDLFVLENSAANCAASFMGRGSIGKLVHDAISLLRRIIRSPSGSGILQFATSCASIARALVPMAWHYVVKMRSYNLSGNEFAIGLEVEQLPTTRSRLTLARSDNGKDEEIALDWNIDGREIHSIREFCLSLRDFVERTNLGNFEIDQRILAADPAFFDDCHDGYHQMGGVRMGETATEGVVDPQLRVFGTDNLWAVGAAVFPTGSFANPTLLAMALAMRLGDTLTGSACPDTLHA